MTERVADPAPAVAAKQHRERERVSRGSRRALGGDATRGGPRGVTRAAPSRVRGGGGWRVDERRGASGGTARATTTQRGRFRPRGHAHGDADARVQSRVARRRRRRGDWGRVRVEFHLEFAVDEARVSRRWVWLAKGRATRRGGDARRGNVGRGGDWNIRVRGGGARRGAEGKGRAADGQLAGRTNRGRVRKGVEGTRETRGDEEETNGAAGGRRDERALEASVRGKFFSLS